MFFGLYHSIYPAGLFTVHLYQGFIGKHLFDIFSALILYARYFVITFICRLS